MTIRELRRWIPDDPRYEVVCIHCGEHIADFSNPECVREAVEAGGGEIIKNAYFVTDCLVACADCADKCLWQVCSALLEDDLCPGNPDSFNSISTGGYITYERQTKQTGRRIGI